MNDMERNNRTISVQSVSRGVLEIQLLVIIFREEKLEIGNPNWNWNLELDKLIGNFTKRSLDSREKSREERVEVQWYGS